MVKNQSTIQETWKMLGWEDPLQEAWQFTPVFLPGESPRTEEPGRLQSLGLQRVGHDRATEHTHIDRKREKAKDHFNSPSPSLHYTC